MANFYDIYQNYLRNPYSGVNAINPAQGIGSLQVKPIVPFWRYSWGNLRACL
jgi:hypothetical protein